MSLIEILRTIAQQAGIPLDHPEAVLAEAAHLNENPGIDAPDLVDLTALPFVTIDARTSKDLDQALFLEATPTGTRVYYALADAAHYVRPGSALFEESLRRGASFYLPGYSVPMLPRVLSEGVVSLNEGVVRRALVFETDLHMDGTVQGTRVHRARVRSRAKLAFEDVQAFYDAPESALGQQFASSEYAESLRLLKVVGLLRLAEASHRDVVRYRRSEIDLLPDGAGFLCPKRSARLDVELYNEQLSLLCNAEGARLLREMPPEHIQPLYRIHPPPAEEDLARFPRFVSAMVSYHQLPESPWLFPTLDVAAIPRALAGYLRGLPEGGPHDGIARAIHRQAVILNQRSQFVAEPSAHFGVGASAYARFSAPMRELVGIFIHKEMTQILTHSADDEVADKALRDRVVEAGNKAKDIQRAIDEAVRSVVLERLFGEDLAMPLTERPRYTGTILGLAGGKVHVELEEPALDIKIYFRDYGISLTPPKSARPIWLETTPEGAALAAGPGPDTVDFSKPLLRVGDSVSVYVAGRDEKRNRWVFLPSSS